MRKMKYKVTFTPEKGAKGADLLLLEGTLSVQHMPGIKDSLLKQLSGSNALHVKVENEDQFDFSFLQLLLGLKIRFRNEGRPIFFELGTGNDMESLLRSSGFGELLFAKY